ncbi:alpha-L-rhamnosidase [Actinotignum timonense]|uniref:alpha-L-rhamnosidase n=1 Tax=Actinotignum TaxID=1653174 RepID=UPI002550F986|nr:alpha-L-rhamnosidase [Actinotignum timonense]MDK6590206.1 family 78 glycoside hydrolase catalytic domain [Actinotignum timonense]MDK6628922.1 family 78 glycoside hydrolase catalytic domain [Actinotignum timonense]MDK6907230.1 family 78 glycoside hydrolase catalytic domain [Actinotignum timonense]MDY5138559.1 family 78 glycoside hydrolase catalytic domain [Actinotignum timonense]
MQDLTQLKGQWISPTEDPGPEQGSWRLRRTVITAGPVRQATAYLSAHGIVDMYVNGVLAHEQTLLPGWMSYRHRMPIACLDVTHSFASVEAGSAVVLDLDVADGWWRGRFGFDGGNVNLYGEDVAAFLHLDIAYTDGSHEVISSDESWKCIRSPRVRAELYGGEHYDERCDVLPSAQADPGTVWQNVTALSVSEEPVFVPWREITAMETLEPQKITRLDDVILVDFGQNAAGRVSFEADIPEGVTVTIRHAEVLQEGRIYTRTLREAHSIDEFTGAGWGRRRYEPRFTVHGFRYIEITDPEGSVDLTTLRLQVIRTPINMTSSFECSNPILNQLHSNVQWSTRSNFVGLPTDCPQRDERMGWTGDIQVFGPTALTLGDCADFLSDWLRDVEAEYREFGVIPWYVPWVPAPFFWKVEDPASVWDDVAILLPWTLYQATGDISYLERHWELVWSWARDLHELAGADGLWLEAFQLGDWLDPTAPADAPQDGQTDPQLVANAYVVRCLTRAADIAEILGKDVEKEIREWAATCRKAFRNRYLDQESDTEGRLTSHSQTAYALAINTGLLEEEEKKRAGQYLADLVAENDYLIGTGFAGTPEICDALTETGHLDAAYRLIEQTKCPSWGYPITMGATTVWERWDSMLPDGTVNPGGMTSFNHYALGAVIDWVYRTVLGINAARPGYEAILLKPQPGGSLTRASGHVTTPHGPVFLAWSLEESVLRVTGEVPCEAELLLPNGDTHTVSGTFDISTNLSN